MVRLYVPLPIDPKYYITTLPITVLMAISPPIARRLRQHAKDCTVCQSYCPQELILPIAAPDAYTELFEYVRDRVDYGDDAQWQEGDDANSMTLLRLYRLEYVDTILGVQLMSPALQSLSVYMFRESL